MGGPGAIIFLVAFTVLGLSVWGLFNTGRSILCALAGIVMTLGAAMGAMHAWGESRRRGTPRQLINSICAVARSDPGPQSK